MRRRGANRTRRRLLLTAASHAVHDVGSDRGYPLVSEAGAGESSATASQEDLNQLTAAEAEVLERVRQARSGKSSRRGRQLQADELVASNVEPST
jgi:hypothetical protein